MKQDIGLSREQGLEHEVAKFIPEHRFNPYEQVKFKITVED